LPSAPVRLNFTRMMRRLLPLFLVPWMVPPLFAVQMEPLSIDQLTERAALVLHGTVLSKSCQRDPEGRIYTKVELDVAQVWKGTVVSNRFTIVHGGGILGREKAVVSGQAEYGIGEEVVVFLALNQRGEGVTLGLSQGKFQVRPAPGSGEKLVRNPFHGGDEAHETRIHTADRFPSPSRLTLTGLKRRVQGVRP